MQLEWTANWYGHQVATASPEGGQFLPGLQRWERCVETDLFQTVDDAELRWLFQSFEFKDRFWRGQREKENPTCRKQSIFTSSTWNIKKIKNAMGTTYLEATSLAWHSPRWCTVWAQCRAHPPCLLSTLWAPATYRRGGQSFTANKWPENVPSQTPP